MSQAVLALSLVSCVVRGRVVLAQSLVSCVVTGCVGTVVSCVVTGCAVSALTLVPFCNRLCCLCTDTGAMSCHGWCCLGTVTGVLCLSQAVLSLHCHWCHILLTVTDCTVTGCRLWRSGCRVSCVRRSPSALPWSPSCDCWKSSRGSAGVRWCR